MAILVLAIISCKTLPTAIHRAQVLYWQRQAMRFTLPPSYVVMESGPHKRLVDVWTSPDYCTLASLSQIGDPSVVYYAKPWRELDWLLSASPRVGAVLYLHERRAPGGKPRLVVVNTGYLGCSMAWLHKSVYEPGSTMSEPLRLSESEELPTFGMGAAISDLRVYAGQSDPADPSHFTIAYTVEGFAGVMDGWLDSSDHIRLKTRTGTPYFPGGFGAIPAAADITPAPASPEPSR